MARLWRAASDRRGQVSLVFALAGVAVLTAVGSGYDLGRAYVERQELSAVAALTCQYANRPSVVQQTFDGNNAGFQGSVNTFLSITLASQNLAATQTNATPFTFTPNGPGNVNLVASVPTTLMKLAGVSSVPVSASAHCFDVPASRPTPTANASNALLVSESFENSNCSGSCVNWYYPSGLASGWQSGTAIPDVSTPPSNAGYVGANASQWVVTGYCLEVDGTFSSVPSVADGSFAAELDCDNGQGTAGNSSISTRVYLQASQSYELRYFYLARTANDNYSPAYICGSAASDTSWATNASYYENYIYGATYTYATSPRHFGARTNQINVYLDKETSTGTFPTHTTLDGSEQLGGSNLIDECVYAPTWIERSVVITASTAGYYWLSFAADGANDSYGGIIDYIRLCMGTCASNVQDNFPSAWSSVNNGGNYKTLFEDTFESPIYLPAGVSAPYNTSGNLNNSYGTTGTSSSGWPNQAASGWATGPTNNVPYILTQSGQGAQALQLAWSGIGVQTSRPFLLVPGYYKMTYDYIANQIITGTTSTYCGATPAASNLATSYGNSTSYIWRPTNVNQNVSVAYNANSVGVFLSNAQLVSTPIGGGALNSTTSYNNPDGTVSTTPTVSPSAISLSSYNAAQSDALLDICAYAITWQVRSANFRIVKPAYYWLTFADVGASAVQGGSIDDVKLTALGGPFMTGAPTTFVTIPVPSPQPKASISYTGFSFPAEGQFK